MHKFPQAHYDLLNEIHANRAARKTVASHHFTKAELDSISQSVGDWPNWEKSQQPLLVSNTLAAMANLAPYIEEIEQ